MQPQTRRLVLVGLFAALGFLLMYFVEFPLPFFPPFLKYDPSGVPSLLAALAAGPGAGIAVEGVKSLLFLLSGKDPTGFLGPAAAFLAGATMAAVTGLLHRRRSGKGWLALALTAGTLVATVVMTVANYFVFLPAYGVPAGQVAGMATGLVLPFNLVKGLLTSLIVLGLAFRLQPRTWNW